MWGKIISTFELYPDIPESILQKWKPGDTCQVIGEGLEIFILTKDITNCSVMLLKQNGFHHGRESLLKLIKIKEKNQND